MKATTVNLRLAILSSFFTYAKKLKFLDENPIELLDREKVQDYASAQALDTDDVYTALQGIDQDTMKGARDYAILSVLLYTGRRAQEVATLQWQHVSIHKGSARLTFEEVVRTRTTLLQAHTHQWLGTFGNVGNADYRGELLRGLEVIVAYQAKLGLTSGQVLIRFTTSLHAFTSRARRASALANDVATTARTQCATAHRLTCRDYRLWALTHVCPVPRLAGRLS